MFVLHKGGPYFWPVKFQLPVDGGKFQSHTFDAQFRRLDRNELELAMTKSDKGELGDLEFCRDVIVGWKGIADEEKTEIPFSASGLDELLKTPGVSRAIVTAFLESLAGEKRKN